MLGRTVLGEATGMAWAHARERRRLSTSWRAGARPGGAWQLDAEPGGSGLGELVLGEVRS